MKCMKKRKGGGDIQIYRVSKTVYPPPLTGKMDLLTAALRYIDHGLAVIPLWPDSRKNPKIDSYAEYLEKLPTQAEWTRWARQWPRANIGVITGYWLNYVCLDFDEAETYQLWCDGPGFGLKGQTWTVQTGRGHHVWFCVQDEPGTSRVYVKNGDDQAEAAEVLLRARGGYCIVPPSIHHTGTRYRTVHKVPPMTIDSISAVLDGWQEKQAKKPPKQQRIKRVEVTPGDKIKIEDLIEIPERSKPNSCGAYQTYCPFHNDSKPSAWVNIQQQRFGCNKCWPGLWWDAINVYAKLEGISNGQAYAASMGE